MSGSIPYSSITIAANRQRKDFDPEGITDLANSIAARGLLHAVVLRETDAGAVLVAGERRLRAMETLWIMGDGVRYNGAQFEPYEVPFNNLGDLSSLEAEEAELDENLKRRDLSWQEKAEALGRLHELRMKQASNQGETHTLGDTIREAAEMRGVVPVGGAYQRDREAILLSKHLDNPLVSKAPTIKEAFKALKREEDRERNTKLAEEVGRTYNSAVHTLAHIDCLDWLKECPDNSFDVILSDPPYGIHANNFGDGGGKLTGTTHEYDDSPTAWNRLMDSVVPELFRVSKPEAHCYLFCDFDMFHILRHKMLKAGWDVFRTPLIVYKLGSGRVPRPEHGPRRQWEMILYALKGDKNVNGIFSDVIPCKLEENIGHGANKPIELYVNLLRRSVRPGDSVLDAFAGTGTIFPAAHECKVYATGIEVNSEYYGICVKRLNALDDEPAMI